MTKYRKKPIIIEAEQFSPGRICASVHWERRSADDGEFLTPYLVTIHEQRAYLEPGDWILPEPKAGRFYPCKPDIFAATYERADTPPTAAMENAFEATKLNGGSFADCWLNALNESVKK